METSSRKLEKKPLLILTGPTAVGKTSLSVRLARRLNGEIISADSMQVYRHMDIGSAKITPQEMEGVPHHLIDVLDPFDAFNVARFKEMAQQALLQIYERRRLPIVAGGTGFYIQALLYDIDFEEEADNPGLRRRLERQMEAEGPAAMHQRLLQVDPASAAQIHPNNQKRVIRALEYYEQTGRPISLHNETERKKESPYEFLYYVLNTDRPVLYQRIDARVDKMVSRGLAGEVKRLKAMGCERNMISMQGLGYKELLAWLDGESTLEEAVDQIKKDTRHFAKRQITWFKRERQVRWLNLPEFSDNPDLVLEHILGEVHANPVMEAYLNQEERSY